MSTESAYSKVEDKYREYHTKVFQSDPSAEDQLIDAEMRGVVKGLGLALEALREKKNGNNK